MDIRFPYDFFVQSLGIETDCQLILDVLKKINPLIYDMIKQKGGVSKLYSNIMKWTVSLFITEVDFYVPNAIIDLLLYFRGVDMTIAMYVLIQYSKKVRRNSHSQMKMIVFLMQLRM